jgi:hypothetical protein
MSRDFSSRDFDLTTTGEFSEHGLRPATNCKVLPLMCDGFARSGLSKAADPAPEKPNRFHSRDWICCVAWTTDSAYAGVRQLTSAKEVRRV